MAAVDTSWIGQTGQALTLIGLFLYDFAMLLLPGFAAVTWWQAETRRKSAVQLLTAAIALSCVIGYAAFWIFFFQKTAGRWIMYALYLASFAALWLRRRDAAQSFRLIREPVAFAAATGLLYLSIFFLFVPPLHSGASLANFRFFRFEQPGDNLIPMIFGDRVYAHLPLRPFCCGDWLSSDRPPLQSGLFLMERPLRAAGSNDLNYELSSTALQILWVCGIWALLDALGVSRPLKSRILGLLVFSGFLLYNSVYTWPKLFAASLLLLGTASLIAAVRRGSAVSNLTVSLAGTCLALGLLAHPGCAFSLPAAAFAALRYRRFFPRRGIVFALCSLLLLLIPWTLYQKRVDPPGNRLLKMHLAGQQAIDDAGVWKSVDAAYRRAGFANSARNKLSNLSTLFSSEEPALHVSPDRSSAGRLRFAEREWILPALGVLNLGWPVWLVLALRKRKHPLPAAGWFAAAAAGNLVIWSLVLFGPSATTTTHGSYPDVLLLLLVLSGALIALPRWLYGCALALQLLNLFAIWGWTRPLEGNWMQAAVPELQWPLLILVLAVAGAFIVLPFWSDRTDSGSAAESGHLSDSVAVSPLVDARAPQIE